MKISITIVVFLILRQLSFSQIHSSKNSGPFFSNCDELPPKYPGRQKAMAKLFADNMKYPKRADSQGVGGKVTIQYNVNIFGRTTDIKVIKGVREDLNQEAVRLIRLLKNWKPATVNGKKINFCRRQPSYLLQINTLGRRKINKKRHYRLITKFMKSE